MTACVLWPTIHPSASVRRSEYEVPSYEHNGITFNPLHRPWAPQCTASQMERQTDRQTDDSIM